MAPTRVNVAKSYKEGRVLEIGRRRCAQQNLDAQKHELEVGLIVDLRPILHCDRRVTFITAVLKSYSTP